MVSPSAPVFLLVGEEQYLKDKAINNLRSSLLDKISGDLDYRIFYGAQTSANEILNCVSTVPFFSSKRLIVIKDFERLPKEDSERMLAYAKNPNHSTCLVIDAKSGDILKNNPSLARYARILKFPEPTGTEVSSWIVRFVSSEGKTIDEDAVEMLKELQGGGLLPLSQELEKLVTFSGPRGRITRDDVENVTGKSVIASAFDIAKAVADKNASRGIAIACDLISSGKRPHEIIGLIAWHLRMMAKIKEAVSRGETESHVSQSLRMSIYRVRDFFSSAAAYSFGQIISKLEILLDADLSIKRSRYPPAAILELAIIKLCLG